MQASAACILHIDKELLRCTLQALNLLVVQKKELRAQAEMTRQAQDALVVSKEAQAAATAEWQHKSKTAEAALADATTLRLQASKVCTYGVA